MPRKTIFKKSQIYDTAFEMFKQNGIDFISARNLAKALNSSPAPIYSSFESIDALKVELLKKAKKVFLEYVNNNLTELKFLNIGMGICIFAREEKELFHAVFLHKSSNKKNTILPEFTKLISREMAKDERFDNLDEKSKTNLFIDAWMFAHGFATLIATNFFENPDNEFIKKHLLSSAACMIYKRLEDYNK